MIFAPGNAKCEVTTVFLLTVSGTARAQAAFTVTAHSGSLADGAEYLIEVPSDWNGTLFLYSHGYVVPGSANPARDVGDPFTRFFMLSHHFALAGSSYATTGWAIHEALVDQIAVLDLFKVVAGQPKRTVAWGHSLGGIITAGLIQRNPERFDAALPMCGVLSGGVATWNTALDSEFAFKTLLAPGSGLHLVNIANPPANLHIAEVALAQAQATPQGRARIALVAALGDLPGWFTPLSPEPAPTDFASQEMNQEVRALYEQAGLDLDADLKTLNETARISADPEAVRYLERNIIFNGEIHFPVLTLHTKGDGLVVVQNESAYREVVDEAGNQKFLRRTFVDRAGHCTFTPAETIAAAQTLINRLDTGRWDDVDASDLNNAAAALGPGFNIFGTQQGIVPVPPAFFKFNPSPYLRPFDALTEECEFGFLCGDPFFERGQR